MTMQMVLKVTVLPARHIISIKKNNLQFESDGHGWAI